MAEEKKQSPFSVKVGDTVYDETTEVYKNMQKEGIDRITLLNRFQPYPGVNVEDDGGFSISVNRYRNNAGFYYDTQLNDPTLSISLHPNTVLSNKKIWVKAPGPYLTTTIEDCSWDCYSTYPIAKAIMSEEFSYSISNGWSDFNMGNPLEEVFNKVKPFAPILDKLGGNMEKAGKEDDLGSAWVNWANGIVGSAAPWVKAAGSMLNNSLIIQGTKFSYYEGTSFNFNNMEMKFTIFSDWVNSSFVTVDDYLDMLTPYVMGIYHPITNDNNDFLVNIADKDIKNFFTKYCGYQSPPGGFKMDTQNLGNYLKGTLRLNIGGRYSISNLVIKNMNVNMSKVLAKHPEKPGEVTPLAAEIILQLCPASLFIDTDYEMFVKGKGIDVLQENIGPMYKSALNNKQEQLRESL